MQQRLTANKWFQRVDNRDFQESMLKVMIGIMVVAAIVWLAYEFWRLLFGAAPIWPTSITGAFDLHNRYLEARSWFTGGPIYGERRHFTYPPASYAMFWFFSGWAEFTAVRIQWAFLYVTALVALIIMITRETQIRSKTMRIFVALLPLAMYATGATIGNGQLAVLIIPALIGATLLLTRPNSTWLTDLTASCLMVFALIKPTVAVPFFWLIVFVPGRLRPALLTVFLYAILSIVAANGRDEGLLTLVQRWLVHSKPSTLNQGVAVNAYSLSSTVATQSTQLLPSTLGGIETGFIFSFGLLVFIGIWVYLNRSVDPWILLGVVAIVARLWAYHRWYDDLLILLPMIALLCIAKQSSLSKPDGFISGSLFFLLWLVMLAPGLHFLPFPILLIDFYLAAQMVIWLACGFFLMVQARKERKSSPRRLKPGFS